MFFYSTAMFTEQGISFGLLELDLIKFGIFTFSSIWEQAFEFLIMNIAILAVIYAGWKLDWDI